jgi:cullin-associated NEDD8-dissociated protein 1
MLPGLVHDSDEIMVISQVAPTAVSQKLDGAMPQLEKTTNGATVTKDTVKQDLERAELQRTQMQDLSVL